MTASPTEPTVPTREEVRRAPKVLLHDHLDGGLRPQTILDLAAQIGHELPADDAESLRRWFERLGELRARWCATSRPSTTPSRSCRPGPR